MWFISLSFSNVGKRVSVVECFLRAGVRGVGGMGGVVVGSVVESSSGRVA